MVKIADIEPIGVPGDADGGNFWEHPSVEELAQRQAVRAIERREDLAADVWDSDAELEASHLTFKENYSRRPWRATSVTAGEFFKGTVKRGVGRAPSPTAADVASPAMASVAKRTRRRLARQPSGERRQ